MLASKSSEIVGAEWGIFLQKGDNMNVMVVAAGCMKSGGPQCRRVRHGEFDFIVLVPWSAGALPLVGERWADKGKIMYCIVRVDSTNKIVCCIH
jgi:hypothetical protein